ncbi:hypothetical protein GCM10010349_01220 [Streptomyces flavofungini]|nr:hypothetical protein GCM10010349_01220 [Streptomyces flavofungini]
MAEAEERDTPARGLGGPGRPAGLFRAGCCGGFRAGFRALVPVPFPVPFHAYDARPGRVMPQANA